MKSRLFLFALVILLVSSCGVSRSGSRARNDNFKIGKTTMISHYEVFQTLDGTFGLAKNPYNGMVIAIKSATQFAPIYDGETISGVVVMTDTYSYDSIIDDNGRTFTRTVPLVVPYKEYSNQRRPTE